ncbi:hypothetical protein, partial [Oscillibacter sp. CU971]|uniref:hypothetical protein n=1 Tax=Oscillibacter sp. CU971 TaxID=2780102 RepID=UPI00195924D8
MRKNVYRILSGFLAVLMLFVATLPAHAISTGSPLYDTIDFYTYVYGIYKGWKDGNPNSDDSLYPDFRPGGSFGSGPTGGGSFSKDEAKAAYDNYVETLPATGYDSSGGLLWSPS